MGSDLQAWRRPLCTPVARLLHGAVMRWSTYAFAQICRQLRPQRPDGFQACPQAGRKPFKQTAD